MLMRPRRRQKNMAQQMKVILYILLIVLVIYTGVSTLILNKISGQAMLEMEGMSSLYTEELDNRFFRINRSLFATVMEHNTTESLFWRNVEKIRKQEDSIAANYAVMKIRDHFVSYAWEYGTEYQFFLYLQKENRWIKLTLSEDGYEESKGLQSVLLEQVVGIENTPFSVREKWSSMAYEKEHYICKIAQYQDVYLGCYVNVKNILEPFTTLIMGEEGYVRLVNQSNQIVGEVTNRGIAEQTSTQRLDDKYSILKSLKQAPFRIQIHVSGEKIWGVMMGSLLFLLLLAAILVLAGTSILIYLREHLLRPVQRFTDNLAKYDDGEDTFFLTESNLVELEQIDGQFKRMIRQIKKLKITLYEEQLEKQKREMDYLKLQIRPHFYLNCLNFIHSMIEFEQYDNARQMTQNTSDYLQYIFRNSTDMVPVGAEAMHCKDYLEILLLRYPDSFEYYIEVHEEVQEALIFPFLMQVYVENAAKHALQSEKKILISVTVFPEDKEGGSDVNIYISDTGSGFPVEILKCLQQGKGVTKQGKHMGIENCLKRFPHYFGQQGAIHFQNSPLGGAIVDIHIPYRVRKEME